MELGCECVKINGPHGVNGGFPCALRTQTSDQRILVRLLRRGDTTFTHEGCDRTVAIGIFTIVLGVNRCWHITT